jgi:hypothetical protein
MGGQMLMFNKGRQLNRMIERDSLNSFCEDDYAGDEEVFDEIDQSTTADQSPCSEDQQQTARRRDPRYADYVNLADFCVVRDNGGDRTSLPYMYSDISRVRSEQPELPKHRPFMQFVGSSRAVNH